MNYGKMIRARKRIKACMRENGIPLDLSKKHWPRVLSAFISERTGEERLQGESHPEFHIRMASKLPLNNGRDLLTRTPKWADKDLINEKRRERDLLIAKTGVDHHIDHIIPIRGKNVCGLHTHENLRVITAAENIKKSNRWIG